MNIDNLRSETHQSVDPRCTQNALLDEQECASARQTLGLALFYSEYNGRHTRCRKKQLVGNRPSLTM